MLFTLGIDSQFGMLEGLATSLVDMKLFPSLPKDMIIGVRSLLPIEGCWSLNELALFNLQILCISCCSISIVFAHGAGSYIFQLMDSFAGSYSLLIIALFECIAVSYVYGIKRWATQIKRQFRFDENLEWFMKNLMRTNDSIETIYSLGDCSGIPNKKKLFSFRFADDIELMTGSRPGLYWMICWKYLSPIAMITILTASFLELAASGSSYPAWNTAKGITELKEWPHWCIVLAIFLILISVMWIPVVAVTR